MTLWNDDKIFVTFEPRTFLPDGSRDQSAEREYRNSVFRSNDKRNEGKKI